VAGSGLRVTGIVPARFAADPDRTPIPLPPADLSFQARDRAVILSGPRRGERVEFLRDESGDIAWLRWDGRLARRQSTSA